MTWGYNGVPKVVYDPTDPWVVVMKRHGGQAFATYDTPPRFFVSHYDFDILTDIYRPELDTPVCDTVEEAVRRYVQNCGAVLEVGLVRAEWKRELEGVTGSDNPLPVTG